MPVIKFMGASTRDPDNTWASTARLLNWYREPVDGQPILKSVLGQQLLSQDMTDNTFIRAVGVVNGVIYAAHGGSLYKVNSDGSAQRLGNITNHPETSISGNNGKVAIAAGGDYFVYDGVSVKNINFGGAFSEVGSVSFFGQRTVLTERDGRRVGWSEVADAEDLSPDFATTESRDDKNIRAITVGGALWIMKERSIEPWYNTGSGFAVMAGSTIPTGLLDYHLVAEIPEGLFFVGSDGKAYLGNGGGLVPVSNVAVETSIDKETPEKVVYYRDEGHSFVCIVFPARPAWCYDIGTREWHERADGDWWSTKAIAEAYGAFYAFDDFGNVSKLARIGTDNGKAMIRRAVSRTLDFGNDRRRVAELRLRGRVGFSLEQPQIAFRTSKDSGHNFGLPKERTVGKPGEMEHEIVLRSLGQFRKFTLEMTYAAPYDFTVSALGDVRLA